MVTSLRPLQSEMSSLDWPTTNTPLWVIAFSLSLVEMHLYAFIAIFVPKLVAMVTPLCPLCTGVSQMNSPMAQTQSHNQTLHGCGLQLKLWPFLWFFWPILAKIWLPWQRPLDPCNQKYLLWIGQRRKPPVISNRILIISHRNAFMCIYGNFCPKIGCRGNVPLSLAYGSVTDEFPDGTNPISKPNSAWMCGLKLKLWPFLWFFGLFWPKFGCHGNVP